MPDVLQLRGGTTATHASFTGAAREVTVDTDRQTLVVHDGTTAGGFALARADGTPATTDGAEGIYDAPRYTVATLPPASSHHAGVVLCDDGAAGAACLAFSDGTSWRRSDTLAVVSAA